MNSAKNFFESTYMVFLDTFMNFFINLAEMAPENIPKNPEIFKFWSLLENALGILHRFKQELFEIFLGF